VIAIVQPVHQTQKKVHRDSKKGEKYVDKRLTGKPGTWIQMGPKTSHGIMATTPVVMLLTLLK
jgi:hypothetical protein